MTATLLQKQTRKVPRVVGLLLFVIAFVATLVQSAAASPSFGTLLVSGSDWLGGQGVAVYSNGTHSDSGIRNNYNGVYVGTKWQCVELAQRLYTARGWHSSAFPVGQAKQIYDVASSMGMEPHANGSGYIPRPGDMIVSDAVPTNSAGHVAIVDRVSGSTVYVVEQNVGEPQTGRGTYNLQGSTLTRTGFPVRGVVHDPDNRLGVPPATTTVVATVKLDDPLNGAPLNTNPVHKQRPMFIQFYNTSNQLAFSGQAPANQVSGTDQYATTFTLQNGWPSGNYQVKVRLDYTPWKTLNGLPMITAGQQATLPATGLRVGDVNQDNVISNTDYNLMMNCYSDIAPPRGPCDANQKRASDLNDDGAVNPVDYNLYLRTVSSVSGD